ncbi:MAG: RNA methyltransferase [Promethearchaeota archaeon CR_4]|nr:MAG: RNA methyltransferase [Candidatus Lokiarchaeota archaeon CR_4]
MMKNLETAPIFPVIGGLPLQDAILKTPELRKFLLKENPPKIDLENRDALILYNTTIAREVLGLELQLQNFSGLIPTPMLRYNFLKQLHPDNLSILEIGTGQTAIISMIAAKCFRARCVATEINPVSIERARHHVAINNLQDQVKILPASEGKLMDGVVPEGEQFDLIITNPPYYDEILSPRVIWAGDPRELLNNQDSQGSFCVQFFQEAPHFLKQSGSAAALISGKQTKILEDVFTYIEKAGMRKEIFGLKAGTRVRWVIRVINPIIKS